MHVIDAADQRLITADDAALAEAASVGDREAFDVLVLRHGPALYRYARRMLAVESDAADVVQDTFVAAWQQITVFRATSTLRSWLFAICYRKIADNYRVKRDHPVEDWVLEPLQADSTEDPFAAASNAAFIAALEEALAQLPARQRASWIMREIEQMAYPEIGEVMQLSADAARGHHHRATAALRVLLRRWQ
ncbi:RNA polymerase subunit sigma-70 [Mycobacterium sp. MS1601]|uniref:RNA polymerase sigma factor n=1 Tax=Mycobacterium sp. MS1601 TaxID=1936029 RepID=UPI00097974ED|nr:RNA polymerase sigma factor [Mycobacterium sp. MS1601]AQA01822.1 RNA polymerase subunit sigma-70 [Mycobacterium sp. MS1601]